MKYASCVFALGAMALMPNAGIGQRPTVKDLLATLRSQQAAIPSLDVAYIYTNGLAPADDEHIYRRLAMDSRGYIVFETSHGTRHDHWLDWPMRVCHYIIGDTIYTHWPNQLMCAVTPLKASALPAELVEDPFLRTTGWWSLQLPYPCGNFEGSPYSVVQSLEGGTYTPAVEIEGPATILELHGASDTISFEVGRGVAVRQRRWHNMTTGVCMTARGDDLFQVADSIWWPKRIESTLVVPARGDPPKTVHVLGRLESCSVNEDVEVDTSFMQRPGMAQLNLADASVHQITPGGHTFLDRQSDEVRRLTEGRRAAVSGGTLQLAASALILLLGGLAMRAGSRAHSKPGFE
jgi:hypothetical protein